MTPEVTIELEDVVRPTKIVITHVGIPAGCPGAAGWTTALGEFAGQVKAGTVR
ncbi:MAG TPA: hypothetical protein VE441_01735 [Mycobacterium sp.]|nr:hypothetical protein [Mycobacterium sp.]